MSRDARKHERGLRVSFEISGFQTLVESRIDVKGLPPGEENLDARHLIDFRAEKRISLGEERFVGVIADIRNLLNDSSVNFMDDVRVGSSGFGVPGSLVFARTLRLGIRLQF